VLLRKDAGFRLREGSERDVALDAGNTRLTEITQAAGERSPIRDEAQLGLQPPAGLISIRVAGSEAGTTEEVARIGHELEGGRVCAKRELDGTLLCFSSEAARAFEPDTTLLRGASVLAFAPSELASFSVNANGYQEIIVRRGDGSYELTAPKGYVHDGSLIADAVQTLGTLTASRWVALRDDPSFELERPRAELEVAFSNGGAARKLSIGARTPGGYFARLSPDPAVFVLSEAAYQDLVSPHIDRSLCPWAEDELASVELKTSHGSGAIRGGVASFPSHGSEIAETLKALRAERAAHFGDALPSEGLLAPKTTVTYTRKDGRSVQVSFGSCETMDDGKICYARRSDVNATFAVAGRILSDLNSATIHDN
jgi:Domain of unknown function (DUF4340)